MIDVPLSVLDLAPVSAGSTPGDALAASTRVAQRAEELGFGRFWVAEHHSMAAIASSAPAVLLAHVAASTSTIRVGSGGVMLPNHAPLVVAEQFGTLHALHPGRVDLGIGRAPGTDPATAAALRRTTDGLSAEHFPEELADLIAYFTGDPARRITATPGLGERPEIWLLGSSGFSAQLAGYMGLPFTFAHHFSSQNTVPALDLYRESFRPSQWLDRPHAMVAVSVLAADSDEHAEFLAGPSGLSFLKLRQGRSEPMVSPEDAARHPYSEIEKQFVLSRRDGQALGSPDTVRRQLGELLDRTHADELMLTTMTYDVEDRLRSLELVREKVVG